MTGRSRRSTTLVLEGVRAGDREPRRQAEILGISERHASRRSAAAGGARSLEHGVAGADAQRRPAVVASAVVHSPAPATREPTPTVAELLWERGPREQLDRPPDPGAASRSPRRRRPPEHRVRRERPARGCAQVDSHLELAARSALLLAVDDATLSQPGRPSRTRAATSVAGRSSGAAASRSPCTATTSHGVSQSPLTDGTKVATQFARAMRELGITFGRSPQAKAA